MRIIDLAILDRPASFSLLSTATNDSPGVFSQEAIDRAIARAATQLDDGKAAVVVYADSKGGVSASTVVRIGKHVTAQAAVLWDGHGFKAEDLMFAGQIVARW